MESDLTCVPTDEGWLYVAGLLDRCSRRLVGWAMAFTHDTTVQLAALMMALRQRQPRPGLIHHSDRGVQYASADYRSALADHRLVASMSRKGNCYDNAAMEAFWSSLKNELVHRRRFATRSDARTAIFNYIKSFYNRYRRPSSLGYQSPLDYESSLRSLTNNTLSECPFFRGSTATPTNVEQGAARTQARRGHDGLATAGRLAAGGLRLSAGLASTLGGVPA